MSRETFAYGAMILLLTNVFNRFLAFAYRILIVRMLGAEGVGLYEMVYSIYSLALVVTTAGLPLALSKITAERMARGQVAQVRRSFGLAAVVLLCAGLVSAAFLWWLSPFLAGRILADSRAYKGLMLTVPALLIVPLCSALRGLFQGTTALSRPAFSQMVEQVVRVLVGLYLAWYLLPLGLDYAAGGLVAGMVCGEAAGFGYLLWAYWRKKPLRAATGLPTLSLLATWRELWQLGFPVTIGRIVAAVAIALEAVIVPQRLQVAGYALRQATELYGQFAGIAMTLLYLPTVLTLSLAITMVPAVAEATARNQARIAGQRMHDALRLTVVGGLPFVVLYIVFPHQIAHLIFNNVQAGDLLRLLAWGGLFTYLQQTSTGILQGLGRTDLAMRNSLIGALIHLGGVYWLTSIPAYGIKGTAIAVVASATVGCYLNLNYIAQEAGLVIAWRPVGENLGAGLVMAVTCWFMYRHLWLYAQPLIALCVAVAAGTAIYLLLCMSTGAFRRSDLERLPWLGQWFRGWS